MVNIRISPEDLLARTQARLAQAVIENQVLDEALERCIAMLTPEQLQRAGFAAPEQAAVPIEDVLPPGAEVVGIEPLAAHTNGRAKQAAGA